MYRGKIGTVTANILKVTLTKLFSSRRDHRLLKSNVHLSVVVSNDFGVSTGITLFNLALVAR